MGKQKGAGAYEKYSLLVPPELDGLVERAVARRGGSKSDLLRELIEVHVREYLEEPDEQGRVGVTVQVNREFAHGLKTAAAAYNLSVSEMIQLILAEQLGTYLQRVLERQQDLREKVELLEKQIKQRDSRK